MKNVFFFGRHLVAFVLRCKVLVLVLTIRVGLGLEKILKFGLGLCFESRALVFLVGRNVAM